MISLTIGAFFLMMLGAAVGLIITIALVPTYFRPFKKMNRKEFNQCYGDKNQKNEDTRSIKH